MPRRHAANNHHAGRRRERERPSLKNEVLRLDPTVPGQTVPWSPERIRAYIADSNRVVAVRGQRLTRLGVRLLTRLLCALSWENSYRLGRLIGLLLHRLGTRRRVAMVNLDLAFGDTKTPQEKQEIYKNSLINMGRQILNYIRVPLMNEKFWATRFALIGEDRIREAYGRGKGVIFLGAHIGAWDFSAGRLGMSGYPIRIIAKALSNVAMDKFIVDARAGMNFGTIAHRDSMDQVLACLGRGEAVGMTIDQNMKRSQGVFVEWLSHLASTVRSVAWVAKRTGAPVLASWAYPTGPGAFAAEILEEVVWEPHPEDPEKELLINTRNFLRPFERTIREHPHLYHWIHRRYKIQPEGIPSPYAAMGA